MKTETIQKAKKSKGPYWHKVKPRGARVGTKKPAVTRSRRQNRKAKAKATTHPPVAKSNRREVSCRHKPEGEQSYFRIETLEQFLDPCTGDTTEEPFEYLVPNEGGNTVRSFLRFLGRQAICAEVTGPMSELEAYGVM